MIYPEGQSKIYTGKLLSIEYELESIEQRLQMSSFIILMVAVLTFLKFIFEILQNGYNPVNSTLALMVTGIYFTLWLFSYRFPLVCFVIALVIYCTNFYLNQDVIFQESLTFIVYRIAVPIILLIGIGNIFYSWFKINQIKNKELEYPDCVMHLNYVVKGEHIYEDQRIYQDVINNIDDVSSENNVQLLTLKNKDEYLNYSLKHHVYNKYSQIFIEKPILNEKQISEKLFESDLKRDINIFVSILENIYNDSDQWKTVIFKKVENDLANGNINVMISLVDRIIIGQEKGHTKDQFIKLSNKIKNSV